ncbi:MAG: GtrA family protein [Clostridiales bacterium]|nr:GtrA family protein [Clostridiales bacterium]
MKYFTKYREIILYLFFGGVTTLVNAIVHFALSFGAGLDAWLSGAAANAVAICFAFFVNKIYVFASKRAGGGAAREFALFVSSRVAFSAMAVGIIFVFVDILGLNEIVFFAISQIFMIVANYVASKWLVFKKK